MMPSRPSFDDVLAAERYLADRLRPTPLYRHPLLERALGCEVHVKHENHQPIGAFKIRGGLYLFSKLSRDDLTRGVVTASTGNHGQSIAYAAREFGARATIVVPEGANSAKVDSMRSLGAEVLFHGANFDDAREYVGSFCEREGLRYIHSADEPDLIAGVGTYTLEILRAVPDLDVLFVPVGGGSGAAGACIAAQGLQPRLRIVGCQSEAAPAAYQSWLQGKLVEAPTTTFAEGVATRTAFELTQTILRDHLSDFMLVSEKEIIEALLLYLDSTRNLAEGAGAIALAAAMKSREHLRGKKIGLVLSGGNISREQLKMVLSEGRAL